MQAKRLFSAFFACCTTLALTTYCLNAPLFPAWKTLSTGLHSTGFPGLVLRLSPSWKRGLAIWNRPGAPVSDLIDAGVRPKVAAESDRFRGNNEPDEVMGTLDRLDIQALHLRHPDYPARLAETPMAPSVIYLRSNTGMLLQADEQASFLRSRKSGRHHSVRAGPWH